jgi:uncharacterized lipoprotein YddW (UPF0748 family)
MFRYARVLLWLGILACSAVPRPAQADEMRAFWCDAWGKGFKTPAQTEQLVDFAVGYGFNAIFVEVRKRGDAYYNSSIEPKGAELPEGYDPLADILARAHRKGIRVHAWIMAYDACTDTRLEELNPCHACLSHSEWISLNDKGEQAYVGGRMYLDPGLPEVRDYITGIAADIARKYPVDGLYVDGLRYPDADWGYNSRSLALFNDRYHRTGIPAVSDVDFCNWRREQVTKLARQLPQAVHRVRPTIQVSAAAYWDQKRTYESFYQDWMGWSRSGYFDFITPMVFVPKTVDEFRKMVDDELAVGNGKNIMIGQGAWRFPAEITDEHLRVIREKGAPGFVIFDYAALSQAGDDGKCLADRTRIVQ